MSLRWNKSVQLQVGPSAVVGSLHGRWSQGGALARAVHAIADPSQAASGPVASCAEAMNAVLAELQSTPAGPVRELRVLLADDWVHLDVVAGDYRHASDKQLQSIAAACVDEVLGHLQSPQIVRWQLLPGMRHLLIAALDAGDVDAVVQFATQHGMRLDSLQPVFCARWNRYATALPDGAGVFAVVHDALAEVAFVRHGAIVALSRGRCEPGLARRDAENARKGCLDEQTDRLLASLGERPGAVSTFVQVVSGSARRSTSSAAAPRWTVIPVEEGTP